MRAAAERPAFYALGRGRAGELLTLLHPPYTAWHLSYFALGAALAPHMYVNRLLWGLAAFALAFDEDEALAMPGRTEAVQKAFEHIARQQQIERLVSLLGDIQEARPHRGADIAQFVRHSLSSRPYRAA